MSVSRFVYRLSVSILVGPASGTVQITLPNGEVESANIEKNVMIYLKSNPLPGHYLFSAGVTVQGVLIERDTTTDVGLLYLDNDFTVSSPMPLLACRFRALNVIRTCLQDTYYVCEFEGQVLHYHCGDLAISPFCMDHSDKFMHAHACQTD